MTELQWQIDDVSAGVIQLYEGSGPLDHWLLAARPEKEFARIAGEPFDPTAAKKLRETEVKFGAPSS